MEHLSGCVTQKKPLEHVPSETEDCPARTTRLTGRNGSPGLLLSELTMVSVDGTTCLWNMVFLQGPFSTSPVPGVVSCCFHVFGETMLRAPVKRQGSAPNLPSCFRLRVTEIDAS